MFLENTKSNTPPAVAPDHTERALEMYQESDALNELSADWFRGDLNDIEYLRALKKLRARYESIAEDEPKFIAEDQYCEGA